MKTSYDILEVDKQATDAEIKQAYLQKVKQFPPDHYQEQFQKVHEAYEAIKDMGSRSKYELFNVPEANFNCLLDHAFSSKHAAPISPGQFIKLLRTGINERIFQINADKTTK